MDEWGGCIVAIIVVALVIGLIYGIIVGGVLALTYIGLTVVIAVEFAAHGFAAVGIVNPVLAWLILGIFLGGTVGLAVGFRKAGKHSAFPVVFVVGGLLCVVLVLASAKTSYISSTSPALNSMGLPLEDKFAGSTLGLPTGIQWANAIGGRGAVFSAANSSRIEYPGIIPTEGTLEFWINVNDGYHYSNSQFKPKQNDAMIFSSDVQGGDVTWPGTTKLFVTSGGKISYWMATHKENRPAPPATEARNTKFRFGEWHAIGVSYGKQGQYIMLDGQLVASSPQLTQTFGAAGNFQRPLDVPTIGETVSHFFPRHTYEGGFDGVLAAFRISAKQSDWVLAKGISVEAVAPPGDAALNTTQLSGDASRADEPHIDSVSTVSPTDVQTITIAGKGFGMHEPYTGDSDFIQASDLTKGWNAGWAKDPGEDKATLVVSSWTDTEIVLSGFAGAYGRDQNVLSAHDNLSFQVWNPQTGLGPATYRITVTAPTTPSSVTKVNISADVANGLVIEKTMPLYPPIAKAARVSGTVVMQATISQLGTVTSLQVISGPAMLQQAALDAVKTWRYRPYLINNEPVEVETTVNVTFSLGG